MKYLHLHLIYIFEIKEIVSMKGEKQNSNGKNGEDITKSILGKQFWYLERSVDIEGADFLVQLKSDSIYDLPSRNAEIHVYGIVQSKFFEIGTRHKIKKEYCQTESGEALNQFFLMCHTNSPVTLETETYFFTAQEILDNLKLNKDESHYIFDSKKINKLQKQKNRNHKGNSAQVTVIRPDLRK